MAITISDIAEKAGVSLATVSRVLNDSGYVKEETRIRVQKVIKDLNYTPSAIARSLSKNKTNTIGVIVPDIVNPFFGEVIKGITEVAEKSGLNIILCNTDESKEKELRALKVLTEQRIQGIIIAPTSAEDEFNSEYLKTLENMGIPIVLVDGNVKYTTFNGVFVDNIKGAYEATEALIKEGHRKIGVITGRMNSKPAKDRYLGYQKALLMNNISLDEKYTFYGDYKEETAYKITKDIIKMKDRPTALFVCSNMTTLGSLKAIYEEKINIPEDISLVAFDKVEILNILGFNISYVNGPSVEMGKLGMQMLVDILNNKNKNEIRRITLLPNLVLKGSEKYKIRQK
ncbi:LacI family DNA-binding transcriptional regulator [Clostridium algidicarnis]|uniref:LacI family transcriptional regulator n=2 Tax=Clostridium algidicarnis TaxID=37659 RepID=A0A2S6FZ45_9CLOT|nr:LacI family DNA-binding transcriptional regulator [Clostridium algidicarnis]MBU3203815.1 LacI family transcriptional regulator [Clostridium algidicarnis]MBU3205917.1 LacI family transcriptional regulator [Clostridium algidicarnis]MBU3209777.1 LacI family transcriptional regulator [Clostridium algidicarnis]MBU3211969.1 LacI family transcriptional regulator [Clostridium algidicarnis]MBU3220193.1 LacI family transcriptional regulator [Clostridium algidicarnis]